MPRIGIGTGIGKSMGMAQMGFVNALSTLFGGVDERVEVADNAVLRGDGVGFAVSCWIKTSTTSRAIISKFETSAPFTGWELGMQGGSGLPITVFTASDTTTGAFEGDVSVRSVNNDTWHLVGFSFVNSSRLLTIYVDGVGDAGQTAAQDIGTGTGILRIGADSNTIITRPFIGNIDEVGIWNTALTGADWTEIFNSGVPFDLNTHSNSADLDAYWRMGDNDIFPTLTDNSPNSNTGTATNMEVSDFVEDTP